MKKSHILGSVSALLLASAALYAAPGVGKAKIDTDGNGTVTKAESLAAADAMFAKLDVNGDGQIDAADREAKLKEHFAEIDTDKNGSISQAEFIAMHKAREEKRSEWRGKAGFAPDGPPMADGAGPDGPPPPGMDHGGRHGKMHGGPGGFGGMKMADANGDKTITKAEFRTAAEARFAKADTNGDGKITQDERKAHHGKGMRGPRPPMPPEAPAPADS